MLLVSTPSPLWQPVNYIMAGTPRKSIGSDDNHLD
jgi:hypothetical protein